MQVASGSVVVSSHRFSRDEYYALASHLDPECNYELLNGTIYALSPAKPPHSGTVSYFLNALGLLGRTVIFRSQDVLEIEPHGSPEPDVAVVRTRPDFYSTRHPNGDDALLVIEVGDTERNPREKMHDYMRDGRIPLAWRIDIPGRCVEIWTPADIDNPASVLTGDDAFSFEGVKFCVNLIPIFRC